MIYFILLKYLYQFLLQNKMLFSKDIKCSDKILESRKIRIVVLVMDPNCLAATGTMSFDTKRCFLVKTHKGNATK